MHIALLDVDIPVLAVYHQRGLYSSQFRRLLENAATRVNHTTKLHTTTFDVVGGSLPPLTSLRTSRHDRDQKNNATPNPNPNPLALPIDGILITGAGAGAYETFNHPWIVTLQTYLQTVYANYPHVKLFGSCFGHQIIAQALLPPASFKVESAKPHHGDEMGLVPVTLTKGFVERFSVLREGGAPARRMRLQMVHGDWVTAVEEEKETMEFPRGWMNVGSSDACPIQGLYCPQRVLTYQGHFEFDVWVTRETVVEFARRYGWEEAVVERYLQAIQQGREKCQDGDDDNDESRLAAEVLVMFFAGEDE
ncbi:hypothetical protein FE257_000576 [Aspergillus nanangensis]|uniref:Class I glutamine amidotransferase-like protein n=1 Tax=Aspergillus nanangensis TaxID=2582783 RepID=A0AAD4CEV5_ASPNN|nr:hypothetical protein FE257_000576 [Aspergillus nanangensis]